MATVQQTLKRAVDLHRGGDLVQAEKLYRQVIRIDPNHADACNLLGISCHQRQMGPEAIKYLERAVALNRLAPSYHANLGMAYRVVGQLDKAVDCYRQSIAIHPDNAEVQYNLGIALHQQEQHAAAEDCFRQALAGLPDHADVLLNLGNALQAQQKYDDALECFRRILDGRPEHFEAQFNLANCYKEQDQYLFASDHFRRAAELKPRCALTRFHLANMLQLQGRYDEAVIDYQQAIDINPNYAEAHNNLGAAWHELRELDSAVACYDRAIELKPDYAEAHNNLGRSQLCRGDSRAALESIHHALALKPELADAWLNLGEVYCTSRQMEEAANSFEQAVALNPESVEGWRRLASVRRLQHRVEEAEQAFRHSIGDRESGPLPRLWLETLCPAVMDDEQAIDDYRAGLESSLARVAEMRPRPTPEEIAQFGTVPPSSLQFHDRDNRRLLEAFAAIYRGCVPASDPKPRSGKPKVGFVVTSGHEGIFYRFMGGVIERLNRELLDPVVVCSPTGTETIRRLRTTDSVELLSVPFRHDLLVEAMRSARFDVLYHFEVGTDITNYFLPFFRLAPVQCTSGGNAQTSGLGEIDYFLSSELQEPRNGAEHYTEELIRTRGLPSYQQRALLPGVAKTREEFGLRAGQTFYACPQKLRKIQPDFDPLLREILDRDPNGVLLLIEDRSGTVAAQLKQRFTRTMPEVVDRVHYVPRLSIPDYLSLTAAADVLLDPLHYSSGATMYDAVSFSKPVVTLPGRFVRGRYALGFYRDMGIDDCVASSPADYANKAVALGTNAELRRAVEERISEASMLIFEDSGIVREYERVFLELAEEARRK